jgi:hypothetical protein
LSDGQLTEFACRVHLLSEASPPYPGIFVNVCKHYSYTVYRAQTCENMELMFFTSARALQRRLSSPRAQPNTPPKVGYHYLTRVKGKARTVCRLKRKATRRKAFCGQWALADTLLNRLYLRLPNLSTAGRFSVRGLGLGTLGFLDLGPERFVIFR